MGLWMHFYYEDGRSKKLRRRFKCAAVRVSIFGNADHRRVVRSLRNKHRFFRRRNFGKIKFDCFTLDDNRKTARCEIKKRYVLWQDVMPMSRHIKNAGQRVYLEQPRAI